MLFLFATKAQAQSQTHRVVKIISESKAGVAANWNHISTNELFYDKGSKRGSTYNSDYMGYDSSAISRFGRSEPMNLFKRIYNADNSVHTEHRWRYENNVNELYKLDRIDSFAYDNGKLKMHRIYDATSAPQGGQYLIDDEYRYNYNPNGELIEKQYLRGYFTQQFDHYRTDWYTYNIHGSVTEEVVFQYTNGVGSPFFRRMNSYDANNNLIKIEDYDYSNGTWVDAGKKYLRYNSSNQLIVDSVNKIFPNGNSSLQVHYYSYNSKGLLVKDSLHRAYAGTLSYNLTTYGYTSFDYYDTVFSTAHQIGTNQYSFNRTIYKYDSAPVSVSAIISSNADLQLYPVPTNNLLNIRLSNKGSGQIKGRIVNLYGQTVYRWQDVAGKNYHKPVMVNHLAAGQYFVVLDTDYGEIKKRFAVVR